MELRTVRRGFATLAITAALGLAGASPASAGELGWIEEGLHWLSGLWTAEAVAEDRSGGEGLFSIWMMEETEKGVGVDPNGGTTPPPPPVETR
jgi:hypothetical protein